MHFDNTARRPAVLVIDMQALFAAPEAPFGNVGCDVLIQSNYVLSSDLSDAGLLSDNPAIEHFAAGAPWIGLDPRLQAVDADHRLARNRPSAFFGGGLQTTMETLGVDALLLAGLSVSNAISATAREGFALDIPCIVLHDLTGAAPDESELDTYFTILDTWTAEVANSKDVIERL
jgi:nicotinamidase-related amidase